MRKIGLLSAIISLLFVASAEAAWQTYNNEAMGYSVTFPGKPTDTRGTYKSDLIPMAPTQVATFRDGEASFLALVVETGRPEDGTVIMGEFEYWLAHFGDVVVNTTSRLNVGMEYGRFLTLDCRDGVLSDGPLQVERAKRLFQDAAALNCPSGTRMSANLFFTQGRLYLIAAMQAGADAKLSPALVRFTNSLQWIAGNAEYGRGLIARSSLAGRVVAPAAPAAPTAPGN